MSDGLETKLVGGWRWGGWSNQFSNLWRRKSFLLQKKFVGKSLVRTEGATWPTLSAVQRLKCKSWKMFLKGNIFSGLGGKTALSPLLTPHSPFSWTHRDSIGATTTTTTHIAAAYESNFHQFQTKTMCSTAEWCIEPKRRLHVGSGIPYMDFKARLVKMWKGVSCLAKEWFWAKSHKTPNTSLSGRGRPLFRSCSMRIWYSLLEESARLPQSACASSVGEWVRQSLSTKLNTRHRLLLSQSPRAASPLSSRYLCCLECVWECFGLLICSIWHFLKTFGASPTAVEWFWCSMVWCTTEFLVQTVRNPGALLFEAGCSSSGSGSWSSDEEFGSKET